MTVRRPQAMASVKVGNHRSIVMPWTAPPVSAATPRRTRESSAGFRAGSPTGSTATIPSPTGSPVAVLPWHRVAGRRDGERARRRHDRRSCGRRRAEPRALRLHRLRLRDHLTGAGVEGRDLPCGQALLPGERREVGDAVGPRALQRCGGPLRLGLERLDLADAAPRARAQAPAASSARRGPRSRPGRPGGRSARARPAG